MSKKIRKTFPLDAGAEALMGVISEYTSPRVMDMMERWMEDFTARVQNDICDRVYDYVYYRGERGWLGMSHADVLLGTLYDLHDEFLIDEADRSLASRSCSVEDGTDATVRAHCCAVLLPDEVEMLFKIISFI